MTREVVRRTPGGLARPVPMSSAMTRRVRRALEEDTAAGIVAVGHVRNAAVVTKEAIGLTGELSAEAERQPRHTSLDEERYQGLIDDFVFTARRTVRQFEDRL